MCFHRKKSLSDLARVLYNARYLRMGKLIDLVAAGKIRRCVSAE